LIKKLVSGEIVLINACVKAKGKHFEHFVHNCQFVMTCNASITVFMNRLCANRTGNTSSQPLGELTFLNVKPVRFVRVRRES